MKKNYVKPSMKVYEFEQKPQLLVGSYETGYVPTIPGMPEDKKHLA